MTVPRVFISSTYYDLRHVRNGIKDFIEYLGFKAVLSEQFDVFYKQGESAQKSCLDEIEKCDMFILIIGTRYGSIFPSDSISITHREYREAVRLRLPIFAFIDIYANDDYRNHCQNRNNPDVDVSKIKYSNVREVEVFEFISEVETRPTDNVLICFDKISEIEDCLRKQLAKMFKEKALRPLPVKEKVEIEKEEIAKPSIDTVRYQSLIDNLNIVGIPSSGISESDIQENENLLELLKSKTDSIDDLGSDFRISMLGSIVNIGKDIIDLLSGQYSQTRGGI